MSGFAHDVATASLPVAIGLCVLAGVARLGLWAQVDDVRVHDVARQYLGPLTTWCLVAVAVNSLAVGAAGDAGVLTLALPAILGAAAVLLRPRPSRASRPGSRRSAHSPAAATVQPEPNPAARRPAATTAAAQALAPARPEAPAPARGLWAGGDEDSNGRVGLWSR